MKSDRTMDEIYSAFIDLIQERPLDKVTIRSIVERCGKNRKTFYYHFVNKDRLIIWVFRKELADHLREKYPENNLVFEKEDRVADIEDGFSCRQFPYYVHNTTGFCTLDHSAFFLTLGELLDQRHRYYVQVLSQYGPSSFKKYLLDLYIPALRNDVRYILGNRYLKDDNIDFLAYFYGTAFVNTLTQLMCDPQTTSVAAIMKAQGNLIHDSIRRELDEQRLRRKL